MDANGAIIMGAEERVLNEINEKLAELFKKIAELKVTENERFAFKKAQQELEQRTTEYQTKIADYKRHRAFLDKKEKELQVYETVLNRRSDNLDERERRIAIMEEGILGGKIDG